MRERDNFFFKIEENMYSIGKALDKIYRSQNCTSSSLFRRDLLFFVLVRTNWFIERLASQLIA